MNIAFQAVVLFVLALPGIVFRRFLSVSGELRRKRAIGESLSESLIASGVLHAACIVGSNLVCADVRVDLNSVIALASGEFGRDDAKYADTIQSITHYPLHVFAYFVACIGIAAGSGYGLRKAAQQYNRTAVIAWLDDDPAARRFEKWVGALTNPETEQEFKADENSVVVPVFAAVVNIGQTPYLYTGYLAEIVPDRDGNPDQFILTSASRRRFESDGDDHYSIPSATFVLRASEIITINVVMTVLGGTVGNERQLELPFKQVAKTMGAQESSQP